MKRIKTEPRVVFLFVLSVLVFFGFCLLLYYNQVAKAKETTGDGSAVRTYDVAVAGNRGEILDKNGNTFVYNEQLNTIIINAITFPDDMDQGNAVLLSMIRRLEAENEEWIDKMPLLLENGAPVFEEDRETDVRWMKSQDFLYMNEYATAENCMQALIEKFGLSGFSAEEARKIASVRYNMARTGFSATAPYTFAEGVSVKTISYFKENNEFYRGVEASVTSERKYVGDGRTAAHVLGIVGGISEEEYEENLAKTEADKKAAAGDEEQQALIESKRYLPTDDIGKSGLEQAMEPYLKGTNGIKTVTIDNNGMLSEEYKRAPKTGGSVITTLDLPMQQIAEKSLRNRIMAVTQQTAIAGGMMPAGAVVVEDVNTGAVLASASYPDFPLASYYEDYDKLSKDAGKPLWNRAFQSGYSPGSTMKPATAIAGLEEGAVTPDTEVYCSGIYEYYDQTFVCYNKTAHGAVNVKTALAQSCNIYFFNIANKLGIQKLNSYSSLLGLGEKTGIEIAETGGILAGYEYRQSIGKGWLIGETLLASIGQSDNSFSALQLTNYCATIANGGTRYKPYLVSKVLSADYNEVLYEREPEIAMETNIRASTLNAVKEGMYMVANVTSCRPYLGDLEYKVACKTGTAEKTRILNGRRVEGTDGFLIAFGPYENPQIAITVVVENAGSGASTAQVAADIFEYYFSTLNYVQPFQNTNTLLG